MLSFRIIHTSLDAQCRMFKRSVQNLVLLKLRLILKTLCFIASNISSPSNHLLHQLQTVCFKFDEGFHIVLYDEIFNRISDISLDI